jgi:hypothetical protein
VQASTAAVKMFLMPTSDHEVRNALVLLDDALTVSDVLPYSGDGLMIKNDLIGARTLLDPNSTDGEKANALDSAKDRASAQPSQVGLAAPASACPSGPQVAIDRGPDASCVVAIRERETGKVRQEVLPSGPTPLRTLRQ